MTTPLFASAPRQPMQPLAITLRPYQQEAVDALYRWFEQHTGNPLVVVPTGGGKSLIVAAFIHSVLSQWPNERILILTHVKELIAQNHAQLLRCWPGAPAGIASAGLRRREHDAPVLFAGIQSVYDKAAKIGWADLVLIDEAHLVPKSGMGMYRTLLDALRSMNPNLKVIGLTATPFRTGEGSLDKGDDRLFHGIAYDCDLVSLIHQGYLSPVISKATKAPIDTSGLHVRAGEFVEAELEAAAMADRKVPAAVEEIVARGQDRRAWLVFCCSVNHARAVADELRRHQIETAMVFGDTPREERDGVVEAFKAGRLRCVVNVNVLTTGFNAPQTDLIALLRPTLSPVLYIQMVGRGLRLAPSKTNCLVLDFGGNVSRHGPIDAVKLKEPGRRDESTLLARECPNCQTLVAIACRVCPECGFEWAVVEGAVGAKHDDKPDEQEIIAGLAARNPIERWDVVYERPSLHAKPGKIPTLRVEYVGQGVQQRVNEWVCFEHPAGSFPRRKAERWWRQRGGQDPVPETVDLAMVRMQIGELRKVIGVTVDTRGEWPELRAIRVEETEAGTREFHDGRAVSQPADLSDIPF